MTIFQLFYEINSRPLSSKSWHFEASKDIMTKFKSQALNIIKKIKSRSVETQIFSPAEDKQPRLAYIHRISTQKCSKRKRRRTQETTLKPDLA